MAEGVFRGTAAWRTSSQEQLYFRESRDRREIYLRVCGQSGLVGIRPERQAGVDNTARSESDLPRLRDGEFAYTHWEPAGDCERQREAAIHRGDRQTDG